MFLLLLLLLLLLQDDAISFVGFLVITYCTPTHQTELLAKKSYFIWDGIV